jgi:hypothetical protein
VDFTHVFEKSPQPNPADDIPITVNIAELANGTIQAKFGGNAVVGPLQADGTFGPNVEGISRTIVIDVLTPFTFVPTIPTPQALPPINLAPPPLVAQVEVVSQTVQRGATLPVESSAGITSVGEERYYDLRVVFYEFDEAEGEWKLVETPEGQRINLNDPRLQAIAPFDLSKLPELFGRLPADRYRIYLIEDGTERLVLDFIIQQGQPLEVPEEPEDEEVLPNVPPGTGEAIDNLPAELQNGVGEPEAGQLEVPADETPPPIEAGTTRGDVRQREKRIDVAQNGRPNAESFAERLGRTPFSTSARREQAMDRLMERFDRRRQPARRMPGPRFDQVDNRESLNRDAHHSVCGS